MKKISPQPSVQSFDIAVIIVFAIVSKENARYHLTHPFGQKENIISVTKQNQN